MRKLSVLLALASFCALPACGGSSSGNQLGGTPVTPSSSITTAGSVTISGTPVSIGSAALTLVGASDGVSNFHAQANLTSLVTGNAVVKSYYDMLPATARSGTGTVDASFDMKVTDEGIQDYFNKDGAAHTLVKYDAQVGDQYTLSKSDGNTITRTVVARSTTDDYSWGGMLIKVITVEQDSRIPGIKKFRYRANHRFGIVSFEVIADDDTTIAVPLTASLP